MHRAISRLVAHFRRLGGDYCTLHDEISPERRPIDVFRLFLEFVLAVLSESCRLTIGPLCFVGVENEENKDERVHYKQTNN